MAIDTAAKRRSASAVGHRLGGRGVTPNASKPVAWRQQAGWGYSGIEASSEADGGFVCATASIASRVNATASIESRVTATASLGEC